MRIAASVMLTIAYLMFARLLHEGYYACIDRPGQFSGDHYREWVINVLVGIVLLLVVAGDLAFFLKDQIIVPATIAAAVALWSLTIRISPEHRDWDEQWFGLYFTGIPIAMLVTGATAKLSSSFKKHSDAGYTEPESAATLREQ